MAEPIGLLVSFYCLWSLPKILNELKSPVAYDIYVGIFISHYKDPYEPTRISSNVTGGYISNRWFQIFCLNVHLYLRIYPYLGRWSKLTIWSFSNGLVKNHHLAWRVRPPTNPMKKRFRPLCETRGQVTNGGGFPGPFLVMTSLGNWCSIESLNCNMWL